MNKKWSVLPEAKEKLKQKFPELNPIILQLLCNRGLENQEEIDSFLSPDYSSDLHDPFLFSQMEKAVKRTYQALKKDEKVLIYGDYDIDGVTSSMVVFEALKELGFKKLFIHLPGRESEGYGLKNEIIQKYVLEGVGLIITVDCGISNKEEIKFAKKNGADVIVTDHHTQPKELPEKAVAIINPKVEAEKYPFCNLAGVGVAFKFVQGVLKRQDKYLDKIVIADGWEKWLLDLVALGTVGDLMPLIGENRTLVKYGLLVLNKTRRQGLKMLLEEIGIDSKELTSQSIGFQIGPRINAAGRMKHANIALSLLMTEDKDMAREISKNLDLNNKDRKSLIDKIIKESEKQIENTEDCCLTILGHDWPLGVVGLVSGRLTDRYYRPALVMTDRGNDISGSGRSIEELNIIEVLQELEDYLAHYGGHPQACGFTLKSKECYDDFCNAFRSIVSKKINYDELLPKVDIDAHILLKNITWDLQESLEKFEPFGEANPSPKFMLSSLTVEGVALLGKNENHLRLMVSQDGFGPKKMLGFFMGNEWGPQIKIGDTLDAIVEISVNQWNGTQELELRIINLKLHK